MPDQHLPTLLAQGDFQQSLLNQYLPAYLRQQRWFTSKGKDISGLELILLPSDLPDAGLALLQIRFTDQSEETRVLALGICDETLPDEDLPCICKTSEGWLVDALALEHFRRRIFNWMQQEKTLENEAGKLIGRSGPHMRMHLPEYPGSVMPDQHSSNTVLIYGDEGFFKLFRKTEPGLHPDAELIAYLSQDCGFEHVPPFGGDLSFVPQSPAGEGSEGSMTIGLMLGRIQSRGEAWFTTLEEIAAYAKTYKQSEELVFLQLDSDLGKALHRDQIPQMLQEAIGERMLERLEQLGRRTAEMHLHFASSSLPDMKPSSLDSDYWRKATQALSERLYEESREARPDIEKALQDISRWLSSREMPVLPEGRIRVHGDYHLGQVLDTGSDVVIIDFEGEPLHSLEYRRQRHSAYKDVAGMARSLHYAPYAYALQQEQGADWAMQAAGLWYTAAARLFLTAYFERVDRAGFVPLSPTDHEAMLAFFLADKALYELAYERASRPDWLHIPREGLLGIARMLQAIR